VACAYGIDFNADNGELWVEGASFDFSSGGTFISCEGWPVRVRDCHFEAAGYFAPTFSCTGTLYSEIDMKDCTYVYTGSPGTGVIAHCTVAAPFGIKFTRPCWGGGAGWSQITTNNALSDNGGGSIQIRQSKAQNATTNYPAIIDVSNTWNLDPNFAQASLADPWLLTLDSATITSRTTGTNISISETTAKPFTGNTNNLSAAKAGAATTVAAFGLLLPCQPDDAIGAAIEYAASANSLGTTAMNISFVQIVPGAPNGVPTYKSQISTTTLTPTTTYQQVLASPLTVAPAWATHVLVEFNMLSMGIGTLYIGQAIISQF
jgi:hypothetical protein